MKTKGTIFQSTARYTGRPFAQDDQFVTAALAEPQYDCKADVPGSYKYDHSIQHAPSPKIGKN